MTEIGLRRRTIPERLAYFAAELRKDDPHHEAVALALDVLANELASLGPDQLSIYDDAPAAGLDEAGVIIALEALGYGTALAQAVAMAARRYPAMPLPGHVVTWHRDRGTFSVHRRSGPDVLLAVIYGDAIAAMKADALRTGQHLYGADAPLVIEEIGTMHNSSLARRGRYWAEFRVRCTTLPEEFRP